MDTTTLPALALCLIAGVAVGALATRSRGRPVTADQHRVAAALDQRAADQAVVRESLDRLHDQMRDLEHTRVSWQSQFSEQVDGMRLATDTLRRETQSLSGALRKPQVRGQWGEMHLRRAVELAGLVDRCDFEEQVRLDDGRLRPDVIVHLAGHRSVVVDAKVPLDAYLDATSTDDPDEHQHHLRRHARQLRTHVDGLSSKSYWEALGARAQTPDFVLLFVPAESFLAAALQADPTLIDYAATRQVMLATPTTLIALLRTVALGWSHEALTEQAREIQHLGRDLHTRLGTWAGHLDQVGRSLNNAVDHYNKAMGSLEARVLVAARRFTDMSVTDAELPAPRAVPLRAVDRRAVPDEEMGGHNVGA